MQQMPYAPACDAIVTFTSTLYSLIFAKIL